MGLLGSGQTLHLLRVPPIGALTFYFPSLRSIVKSLRANHCPPQCVASELEMSQCSDVFSVISKFDFVLSPGNVLARL